MGYTITKKEATSLLVDFIPELAEGDREYICKAFVLPVDWKRKLTNEVIKQFQHELIVIMEDALPNGEEWMVDERYALIYKMVQQHILNV